MTLSSSNSSFFLSPHILTSMSMTTTTDDGYQYNDEHTDGQDLPPSRRIKSYPNGTLTVLDAHLEDEGWYSCQVRSSDGHKASNSLFVDVVGQSSSCLSSDHFLSSFHTPHTFLLLYFLMSRWDDTWSFVHVHCALKKFHPLLHLSSSNIFLLLHFILSSSWATPQTGPSFFRTFFHAFIFPVHAFAQLVNVCLWPMIHHFNAPFTNWSLGTTFEGREERSTSNHPLSLSLSPFKSQSLRTATIETVIILYGLPFIFLLWLTFLTHFYLPIHGSMFYRETGHQSIHVHSGPEGRDADIGSLFSPFRRVTINHNLVQEWWAS